MNPELLRNLWLNFSRRRLILMPCVLGVIFITAYAADSAALERIEKLSPPIDFSVAFSFHYSSIAFAVVFGFIAFLWGTRLAADSLYGEVAGRTWDTQRSSAIGPWSMIWGKLVGGTAYSWYGVIFCLAFWAVRPFAPASTVVTWLALGMLAQAVTFLIALLILRGAPGQTRFRATLAQLRGLASVGLPLMLLGSLSNGPAHWYALEVRSDWFVVASLILAVFWAMLGCFAAMRAELQYQEKPAIWFWFIGMVVVYAAGLATEPKVSVSAFVDNRFLASVARASLLAGVAMVAAALLSAVLSPPGPLAIRRRRAIGAIGIGWPWIWPAGIAAGCLLVASIAEHAGGGLALFHSLSDTPMLTAVAAMLMFALRDIGFIHCLTLNRTQRRGLTTAILLIVLGYCILPLSAISLHAADLSFIFIPFTLAPTVRAIGAPMLEAIIIWLFALNRFRTLRVAPALIVALLVIGPRAEAAGEEETCPRISPHEVLLRSALIFTGTHLPPQEADDCTLGARLCERHTEYFRIEEVLKGEGKPGDRVSALVFPFAGGRPVKLSELPDTGLFALDGGPDIEALARPPAYTMNECSSRPPAGLELEGRTYLEERSKLDAAVQSAPDDPGAWYRLADLLLRYRDPSVRTTLPEAVTRFPRDAGLRAELMYVLDPKGQLGMQPSYLGWQNDMLDDSLRESLRERADRNLDNDWVRRRQNIVAHTIAEGDRSPDFEDFRYDEMQLSGRDLRGAKFDFSSFVTADLRATNLSGVSLEDASFSMTDLSYANLARADLRELNPLARQPEHRQRRSRGEQHGGDDELVIGAENFGSPLSLPFTSRFIAQMKLLGANLDDADLTRATLRASDLRDISARGANFSEADLRGSDLRGANLESAILDGTLLTDAKVDCRTVWPDGYAVKTKVDPAGDALLCPVRIVDQ